MNILIIGAGALGVALGASLAGIGHRISYIAYGDTADAIAKGGIHRRGIFGDVDIPPNELMLYRGYDALPQGYFDAVLVTTKSTVNAAVARELGSAHYCMKHGAYVLIMQNGWGSDEAFLKHFDHNIIYNARVITGFERPERNISRVTVHTAPILLGSLSQAPVSAPAGLAGEISRAGIPCEVTEDISKALWAKMLYNCALNPLGALLSMSYGEMADSEYARPIIRSLIIETFSVMKRSGYSTYWAEHDDYLTEFFGKLIPDTHAHRSSMLQDFEKKHKTEIEALSGAVVRMADSTGQAVPVTRTIYRMVKTVEEKF